MIDNNKNLFYLDELPDYKIAPDDCDVRGWEVLDSNGRAIGNVESLLVNKQSQRVVYLEVELQEALKKNFNSSGASQCTESGETIKEGSVYIVVPVGMVDLKQDKKQVITTKTCYQNLGATSVLSKGYHIDPDYVARM